MKRTLSHLVVRPPRNWRFFFFNDTATTEIYTLSLHDALPICVQGSSACSNTTSTSISPCCTAGEIDVRSEEHTSELQSRLHLVCRLLLEKKKIRVISILPVSSKRRASS